MPNGVMPNGVMPNGVMPNGVMPNGVMPNGVMPNGVMPNGVMLNGVMPNGVMPNGALVGVAGTGAPLAGSGVVGSTWAGNLTDGTTIAIRIDEAMQLTGGNADLWSYRISGMINGVQQPLCVDPDGNPRFAVTVTGTWNLAQGVAGGGSYHAGAQQFTIACRGSTIAKCVELGYKPWTGHSHQLAACVRALRADYCGDGVPYTVNGTLVNLYDAEGVQLDTEDWEAEAEWTPDGAGCVSKKKAARFDQAAHTRPSCYPHALKPKNSCGTGFSGEVAIITELPPQ